MVDNRIKVEEIKNALSNSGYFLETRVLSALHKKKYTNIPNSTYPDKITGKSRELDIYSESERITENLELNHYLHFEFQHRMIIECSNNPQPVVFFKRPDRNTYTIFEKFKYSKIEREIANYKQGPTPDYIFHDFTTSSKEFHYNQFLTNTQYCSFIQKKTKEKNWMASHPDGLHDTFNKLFDCTSHKIEKFREWMPKSAWRNDVFVLILFPVLILQNKLFEANEVEGKVDLEEKKHVLFEFNRYTESPESLLIDIITEDYLDTFVDLIIKDVTNLKNVYVDYYKSKKIKAANSAS
ncbi:MAG: hypothetical protein KAT33_02795 [Bacteroidales bacterium]|jgi:hypothetical protein|nr:hypothetical protein [Bacteroidales bacterium]MCK4638326.1 hypothetical protein [Bacteroidales bacterium]